MWFLLPILASSTTVHFVPHSHIDVGWIDVTSYYYTEHGSKIMNTMLHLLEENPSRKFCWSEAFFLASWLKDHPDYKDRLKTLIKNGQLEIVGGGWVMNDEALTDFESVARQVEAGHRFLREELGAGPIKVAWQLDPFGHSSLTPGLFEKLGFEFLVMSRVDGNYRTQMRNSGNMEFLWKSNAFGAEKGLFTHLLFHHYSLPEVLDERQTSRCFQSLTNFQKDVKKCVEALENYVKSVEGGYKSSNILILYGDDISFKHLESSRKQFELVEALIEHSTKLRVKYSTPSEYFQEVLKEDLKYSVFEGDFLPYVSEHIRRRPLSWTGFFSSRPALKKRVFEVENLVRTTEILAGLSSFQEFEAREVSVLLHHDAITGTCQPDTAEDYFKRLKHDEKISLSMISSVFHQKMGNSESPFQISLPYKVFFVFNSLTWPVKKIVKVPINQDFGRIFNRLQHFESQVVEVNGEKVLFWEMEIEGLSLNTVFLVESSVGCKLCSYSSVLNKTDEVDNGVMNFQFNEGLLESISFPGHLLFLATSYIKYEVNEGGAYEFRPRSAPQTIGKLDSFKIYSGPLLIYVESIFKYSSKKFIQKLTIPLKSTDFYLNILTFSEIGDEIFLKIFNSNSKKDWLYTFNSADVIKRYQFEKRVNCYGENGFPVVGALLIDYKSTYMNIFPKFPFGAHLAENDYFLIHLHRNPPFDDVLGLGSPLLDKVPVEHEFLVTFGKTGSSELWKNYLGYKNSPNVFAYAQDQRLDNDLENAVQLNENWELDDQLKVGNEDDCVYLSRIFLRNDKTFASVLNVCDQDREFRINDAWVVQEVQADGYPWTERQMNVKTSGSITFKINKNTPETLWKYYLEKTKNLSPYHLRTFELVFNNSNPIKSQSFIGLQTEKSSLFTSSPTSRPVSHPITAKPGDLELLFGSVLGLFGISVALVLMFMIFKMRSSKKLD